MFMEEIKKYLHLVCGVLLSLLALHVSPANADSADNRNADTLALLLPDGTSLKDPRVMAWQDAAAEEGLRLEFMSDSQFLLLGENTQDYKGIILPDQLHQRASDMLINAIKGYVSQGGNLMLVYDAGALTDTGFYPSPKSRLSDLAGVDYVLYDELRELTIGLGPVLGMEKTLWSLQVPPGKSMPFPGAPLLSPDYLRSDSNNPGGVMNYDHRLHHKLKHKHRDRADEGFLGVVKGPRVAHDSPRAQLGKMNDDDDGESTDRNDTDDIKSKKGKKHSAKYPERPQPVQASNALYGLSGYVYGFLDYPSFVTRGDYTGTTLLTSMDFGLVAGVNKYGKGSVLFINTPLSYLKGQTDGMLLHGFVRYFGATLLELPRLANNPRGRGGMVLNWHVDAAEAEPAIAELDAQGIWDSGPFSIHITAGPDTIVPGDGLGLDINNNPAMQAWIRYFLRQDHQVASHGGWIHDYYGYNANEFNEAQYKPYLVMNRDAIERVTGRPNSEYSAPQGNNPAWAMQWLEETGIRGFYTTAHTGMGPTRNYQQGMLMNPNMWAFPVSTLGEYATFEEFADYGVSTAEITRWLDAMVDFTVQNRTSRQVYFHPPGAALYPLVLQGLMARADAYAARGEFSWYTMTDLADFMDRRSQVSWQVKKEKKGKRTFVATHPSSLAQQTWLLPKSEYKKPRIKDGKAYVKESANNWLVIAKSGTKLKFSASPVR